MRTQTALLTMLILAACNAPTPESGPVPNEADAAAETGHAPTWEEVPDTSATRRTGTIRVVGSAPVSVDVVVRDDDGNSTVLEGPLRDELRNLSGTRVEVTGRPGSRAMEVTDYRVISVDGRPVMTGVVEREGDGDAWLTTEDGRRFRLSGAVDHLEDGAKVWVQGEGTVRVRTSGRISP